MPAKNRPQPTTVDECLLRLRRQAKQSVRNGMARFGIPSEDALGVTVVDIRAIAKAIGRDHELALALWPHGVYEARMLACFLGEPARVTVAQMDAWCKTFDSWAICDTACFHLFDRSPLAWGRLQPWAKRTGEFQKRAAFALLASLALHDKKTPDERFVAQLPLIAAAATDGRNFVKKAVSWALRGIGKRGASRRTAALGLAVTLAASTDAAERWIGKDALRDLQKPRRAK